MTWEGELIPYLLLLPYYLSQRKCIWCWKLSMDRYPGYWAVLFFRKELIKSHPDEEKFVFQMDEAERAAARAKQNENLAAALARPADLLVLDEACAAWQLDMVDHALLERAVRGRPAGVEVVLTGRHPAPWMLEAADYSTELRCCRHPYEKGVKARRGVEF